MSNNSRVLLGIILAERFLIRPMDGTNRQITTEGEIDVILDVPDGETSLAGHEQHVIIGQLIHVHVVTLGRTFTTTIDVIVVVVPGLAVPAATTQMHRIDCRAANRIIASGIDRCLGISQLSRANGTLINAGGECALRSHLEIWASADHHTGKA